MEQTNPPLKIEELEAKLDKLQHSIDRLNKIFLWALIITIALIVLPLIGMVFVLPTVISSYTSALQF
jgi:polyferredoxin